MKSSTPDISVIIVNWNTRKYLVECIDSLKKTTKQSSLEIIVVDNGSTDGSQAALAVTHPDVRLIQNATNLGFAKANNIGIVEAKGRYVCLVNTDIVALDTCLDDMLLYADSHPEIGTLGPKTVDEDLKLRPNCRKFPTLLNAAADHLLLKKLFPFVPAFEGRTLKEKTYEYTHEAEVLSGCFLLVRRVALDAVGLLDERFFFYGEDTDWSKRFHDAGWKNVFLSEACAIHYGGATTSAYPIKYYLTMEKADMTYWGKHRSVLACILYGAIKVAYHGFYGLAWILVSLVRKKNHDRNVLKMRGHLTCLIWLIFRKDFLWT